MKDNDIEKNIKKILGKECYEKSLEYPKDKVHFQKKQLRDDTAYYFFSVENKQFYWQDYDVLISNDFKDKIGFRCNCNAFYYNSKCPHIAACFNYYGDNIFNTSKEDFTKEISKDVLNKLLKNTPSKYQAKEELKLEVELNLNGKIGLRIGTDRLYMLKNKMQDFIEAYVNNAGTVEFGKNFIYDANKHYFNELDTKIINIFIDHYYSLEGYTSNTQIFELHNNGKKLLLNLIKEKGFSIKNGPYIKNIKEGFPLGSKISKKGQNYIFSIELDADLYKLTDDFEYILYENECYHLKKHDAMVLKEILNNNMETLIFDEEELETFSKSILPTVKEKVEVDSSASNIIITKKPDARLYFDMNYNDIICNVKLEYGSKEIDYFDNDKEILRDMDYEGELINNILKQGFINKKNKLTLDEIEDIGSFLDTGIKELSEKYETFTSTKIRNISIEKNTNIKSTFSIGKDNIMHYNFSLGDINPDELDEIFTSLKKKKKYYRLKSGNFIDLNNNAELEELEELAGTLNLTTKDITSGVGEIPKYRALYLDSLKKTKYNIIETDNIFDEFIENFHNYQNMKLTFTKDENNVVRDYQKIGIKWLYNIYKCGFGGILADEMGLGKSLQTLYFIKKVLKEKPDSKFLIVVPTSLVYNWENEILKFTPKIKYAVLAGTKEKRKALFEKQASIYITSYGLLREDFDYYEKMNFEVCIIDEAQNIKNPNTVATKKAYKIKAHTKIALTGTPLENSVTELWSIFNFIMPGFLGSLLNFSNKYSVKEFDDTTNKMLSSLNKQISPFILRRKKKDVLTDLPEKIENNIFIELSPNQKKLYAKEVEKVNKEVQEIVGTEGWSKARFLFLGLIMRLRQLCIDPRIVYENYTDESSKMENLVKVVKDAVANEHKILIFSSFKTALDLANSSLNNEGITTYMLDGSVSAKKRMQLVDNFNNDNTNVFLIMLKAGGTGLNLTSADIVIHLDLWWNPQAENQATDRAHRIGQKNNVEVVKLVALGTIEEKILELQEKKKMLSDKLIEGDTRDQNVIEKLTEEDLKYLISYEQEE